LFDVFSKESPHKETALASSLLQILLSLSDAVTAGPKNVNPLSRSLQHIHASYTDDIQIPALATMENLSNSRYHVLFKETVGMSPRSYITMLRMRHACDLLNTTNLTVKQIGALVGYEDSHFFCKIFKSKIGVSPSLYRKSDQSTVK
jgi:YesN/AraC family two-component response regulator